LLFSLAQSYGALVFAAPVADFADTPTTGIPPLTVNFEDLSAGETILDITTADTEGIWSMPVDFTPLDEDSISLTAVSQGSASYPVTPDTIKINDQDNDRLADDWELDYGFDPSDPSDGALDADADGDGYSNYQEYQARTDPNSSGSIPFELLDALPPDNTGITGGPSAHNDTSFAVLIASANGINITSPDSVRFTVDEGISPYDRDLRSDAVRAINISTDDDNQSGLLWIVYDRSLESSVSTEYPFDTGVNITVNARDINGNEINTTVFDFHIETAVEFDERTGPDNLPDMESVPVDDPDLDGILYDAGVMVNSGELAGAKILYNSSEPLTPTFGPINGISHLGIAQVAAVGAPMNLQPSTVFNTPVKIFIPCPGYTDVSTLSVYIFDGVEWQPAIDPDGNILPGGIGWMVPGSRVNHNDYTPAVIEIQVYHFSEVQAGTVHITVNNPPKNGSGSSGSCTFETVAFGSKMEPYLEILRNFRDRILLANTIGREIVDLYYKYSPPIADYLRGHALPRAVVKHALIPVTGVAWMMMHFRLVVMIMGALLMIYWIFFTHRPLARLARDAERAET
jgi:hypothetical protein